MFEEEKAAVKKWWASMTLWFNGVMAVVLTLAVEFLPTALDQLPILKEYMPTDLYKWAFIITIVGNAILRVKTKTAVTL